ncbi:MAG TPA: sugar phosphate isomerase/epimerase [Opitutaceae bacterium]|nr:sugar phosphate isomerase/epimerase [Opitutaceae bacterium]
MKKIPVALQLYSVREEVKRDFAAAAAEVANIGYSGVELAGYGNLDAKGAKAALDAAGLEAAGMHVGYAAVRSDPGAVISDALLLGTRNVVCSWWPPGHFVSASACERIGEQLGEVGEALRPFGIRFGFHNHDSEFRIFNKRPALDWILGAAEPRNLFAEVDVFWAHAAGYPPSRFIREQGARIPLLHLKDAKELGQGPVDFAKVFDAADSVGAVDWFIVEQEEYSHAPIKSVRLCFEQMKAWGRA